MEHQIEVSKWFQDYWYFANERMQIFYKKLEQAPILTENPIFLKTKFTNAYRVLDRVSQYLIQVVQTGDYNGKAPNWKELTYRTLLFKIFNKIETWEKIEEQFGPICSEDWEHHKFLLKWLREHKYKIWNGAYIMTGSMCKGREKSDVYMDVLLDIMDKEELHKKLLDTNSLEDIYNLLRGYPLMGNFIAFQFAIDINYFMGHTEEDFVVYGPGAKKGVRLIFFEFNEDAVWHLNDWQEEFFNHKLFGKRKLMPIDLQNCLCELSKWQRLKIGRRRTKAARKYRPRTFFSPRFPPSWDISVADMKEHSPNVLYDLSFQK